MVWICGFVLSRGYVFRLSFTPLVFIHLLDYTKCIFLDFVLDFVSFVFRKIVFDKKESKFLQHNMIWRKNFGIEENWFLLFSFFSPFYFAFMFAWYDFLITRRWR